MKVADSEPFAAAEAATGQGVSMPLNECLLSITSKDLLPGFKSQKRMFQVLRAKRPCFLPAEGKPATVAAPNLPVSAS